MDVIIEGDDNGWYMKRYRFYDPIDIETPIITFELRFYEEDNILKYAQLAHLSETDMMVQMIYDIDTWESCSELIRKLIFTRYEYSHDQISNILTELYLENPLEPYINKIRNENINKLLEDE